MPENALETSPAAAPADGAGPVPEATPRRRRRRRRVLLLTALGVVVLLLVPLAWVQAVGGSKARDLGSARPAPVAIVLGAGLRPDGSPSTYLRRRLDAAQALLEAGTVQVILVSGDNATPEHDEPTAMRDHLVANGVPAERVVRDFAGFDTHDTCVRAHDVFGVDAAVVVTQDYHLPRALWSCSAAGIDVTGVGVSSASVQPRRALLWRLREVPASTKAWWDGLTHREPEHLGRVETGVQDALARAEADAG